MDILAKMKFKRMEREKKKKHASKTNNGEDKQG